MKIVDGFVALTGDGSYKMDLLIDFDHMDLIVRSGNGTWWDDHETASGIPADTAGITAVSLPMNYDPSCKGSPIPKLPFWDGHSTDVGRSIIVYSHENGVTITALPLIDVGPASPNPQNNESEDDVRHIDLTPHLYDLLGGDHRSSSDPGHITVDYRIVGGARYLPANILSEAHQFLKSQGGNSGATS